MSKKPSDSGGFFVFGFSGLCPEIYAGLAGHPEIALLNDALL
jgi:hypothetical protein